MNLFTFNLNVDVSFIDFIDFWSKHYDIENDTKYNRNISVNTFDEDNIIRLFEWKNQMILSYRKSNSKMTSLENKILSKLKIINEFRENGFVYDNFENEFSDVSFVWRKFLLHLISPNDYPIYDKNIHLAFEYIVNTIYIDQETLYLDYVAFLKQHKSKLKLKKIDEALISFGKFMNRKYNKSVDPISDNHKTFVYKSKNLNNWKSELKKIIFDFNKKYDTY
ncbi:MAG: hypothetical protein ABIJ97_08310, partial [Bacteroidota bacterium]